MNLERVQAEGVKTLARFSAGNVYDIDIHEENAALRPILRSLTMQIVQQTSKRSISSSYVFFGTCLLHSSSRTQKLVSLSTGKSET